MVLAQKTDLRTRYEVKQCRRLRYGSIQLPLPDFWQRIPKIYDEEKTASSTNVTGKT
jgi:hypothetical protein